MVDRQVVAHLIRPYLFLTGSWIHHQLTNIKRFRSIVLTTELVNTDVFPYDPVYVYDEIVRGPGLLKVALSKTFEALTHRQVNFYVKKCRENNADLLHAHFGTEGYYQLPVKRVLGVPLVTTFYGVDISKAPGLPKWQRRYRRLFQEGQLFLAEGSHMAQTVVDLGCSSDKVKMLHLGVDLDSIKYMPRAPDESGKIKFLLAASFREKKGIPYAIEAFAMAGKQVPNLELTIIGGAKTQREIQLLQKCRDIAAREGVSDQVRFLGYVPYPTYLEEQKRAHIFLAPSVTASDGDTEGGAPVSVIEASAAGMPVISTWHCDIPEVVCDGVSGVLVPERDVEALTQAILELATAPECWNEMGKAGRDHIEAEYDVKKQVTKLEQVYRQLM